MKVLDGQQLLDFMEIIEDRHGQKATIMISQLPVSDWYDVMKGNTTAADAILDRLVHTSVRFELKGASLRQKSLSSHWKCKTAQYRIKRQPPKPPRGLQGETSPCICRFKIKEKERYIGTPPSSSIIFSLQCINN